MRQPKDKKIGFIKAAVLGWLGLEGDIHGSVNWSDGKATAAGQTVNEKTVMSLSAVFACVKLISEAVGTLPYNVYQKTNNSRVVHNSHNLYDLLKFAPNSSSTPAQFWSAMVASMLLWGNAFAEIVRLNNNVVSLKFILPNKVSPIYKDGLIVAFDIVGNQQPVNINKILHIANFGTNGQWGLSTISSGANTFGNALAGLEVANNTFERGLSPTTAIKVDRVIKPQQRESMRNYMQSISGAINSGQTAVLEGGMSIDSIGINPKDAQLLESRDFSTEEICRLFGVDPSMVGRGGSVSNWGTGLEQKMIGFLTFTIRPLLKRIEQAVNRKLLTVNERKSVFTEFNIEGLLRADSAGRAEFYSKMIDNGTYTRDEVRAKENLPLMGGNSAKQTIQSGFVTLDSLGVENNEET